MDRALGEDWEGKERKNVTCSDEEGAIEEREWGRRGVQEGASVRLERSRERYAWLCDSSYIEHGVCVDTDSCISLRNKLFLLAQCTASSSPLYSPLPLCDPSARSLPPTHTLPYLWFKYILRLSPASVSPSPVSTRYNCCGLTIRFSLLPLSVSVELSYALFAWMRRQTLLQEQQLSTQ